MQTTLRELCVDAIREEPRHLQEVYQIVTACRPGTALETIRARLYEELRRPQPRVLRIDKGVYVAVDGPARLVLIEGDAWDVMKRIPTGVIDAIVTDAPWDLGTEKNAHVGTTRPHKDKGRTYQQRDLDREMLTEMFRVLSKTHEWASIAPRTCSQCRGKVDRKALDASLKLAQTGACKPCGGRVVLNPQKKVKGGGACFLLTPPSTRETRPHINTLLALAESIGFQYVTSISVPYGRKGMGYWLPQEHWEVQFLIAGRRAGVPHDLTITSVWPVQRVLRSSKRDAPDAKKEHEAEKPVEWVTNAARVSTQPGDIVLDMFAGRGRSAKHLMEMGRHVVMIELDPTWTQRILTEDFVRDVQGVN